MKPPESPQSQLTADDLDLIVKAKQERERLRAEASALSDKRLAEKFEVSRVTIQRVRV